MNHRVSFDILYTTGTGLLCVLINLSDKAKTDHLVPNAFQAVIATILLYRHQKKWARVLKKVLCRKSTVLL